VGQMEMKFILYFLAKVTQVSDVAHGPLVLLPDFNPLHGRKDNMFTSRSTIYFRRVLFVNLMVYALKFAYILRRTEG
jgi:hypothetical protein